MIRLAGPGTFVLALAMMFAAPAARAEEAPGPPLNIAADNVTGSRGPEGDIVLLNGHVRITRARTVLTAETGRYLRGQGMLYLDGQVTMVDSSATLTSDHASYSETEDLVHLDGNVVVRDHDTVLRSPSATYDRRAGRADLTGPVTGRDKDQQLFADRAFYFRDSQLVQARGHVRGLDDPHRLELNASSVDYDRATHVAIATGDPVLKARGDDEKTTEIHAQQLRIDTQSRVAEAIDSVRVRRDTLQARADHALFDDVAQHGWLTGHPRMWDDETTVDGDSVEIFTHDRALTHALVTGHASMRYVGARPATVGETSLLEGERAEIYFTNEDIDSLVAIGSARNEYQGVARAGQTAERNLATGDTITVFFVQRKIDRARVEGGAKGTYRTAVTVGDTSAAKREVVDYDAKRIEFHVPRSLIVLDRDAHLTYSDLELHAKRVEFDIEKQTLVARGSPVLNDRGDKVTGNLMTYDLESRVGTIYQAETAYERGLYHGQRIRKVGDDELDVMNGAYSTCDLTQPHYHFAARYMKIYLKDKLVAKPVVFYVRNVPLFALPFWVFPIKPGRHSGFLFPQFEFGFNNQAGQFLRNAGYYWAPNDYMDFTAAGDYYQADPSWVMRAEGNYKLLYALDGNFRGTFARDENPNRPSENWDFNANHSQEITPRTHLTALAQFVSSKEYNSSNLFGRTLADRLNRFLTSSLALSHNADWASINAVLDRRQDLDADQSLADPDGTGPLRGPAPGTISSLANLTESTPSLSILFPTRAIGSLGLLKGTPLAAPLKNMNFSLETRFLSLRQRHGIVTGYQPFLNADSTLDSTTTVGQEVSTRRGLAATTSLSDPRRLFGWLNFSPRLSANVAVFDFDELGHKVVPTGTWSSGVTTSSTFYGTYQPRLFGLKGLRHIVSPSVSFSYSPEFPNLTFRDSLGFLRERFTGFGNIAVSGFRTTHLDFALDQRLQVKYQRHGKLERLDNLLAWGMAGSYNFLWREQGQRHPLSAIGSNVFLQPPGLINVNLNWITDVYSQRPVRSLSYNVGMSLANGGRRGRVADLPVDVTRQSEPTFNENWSVNLAYSYSGGYEGPPDWVSTQTANAVGRYQISPAWGLEYSSSYNITLHSIQTQRFGLTRDLHCWAASFTRTFSQGGEAEYYFRLAIKDQKEIYVERGTRVGSIGGIQ